MKPLFGIDVTENPENEQVNGEGLIVRTLPKKLQDALEARTQEAEDAAQKSRMPLWFRMVRNLCGYFGLIVFVAVVSNLGELGFSKIMKNAPLLVIGGGVALVVWAVMFYLSIKRARRVAEQGNVQEISDALDKSMADAYRALGVPQDAANADVLAFSYRVKEGAIKPHSSPLQTTPYLNLDLKAFVEDGNLCLADLECVHAIPLSSLVKIHTVQKRISIPVWSKEIEPREGVYKAYKMSVDKLGDVFFKPYHILEFTQNGEAWGVYFPCYELPTFEALTGLSAEEE